MTTTLAALDAIDVEGYRFNAETGERIGTEPVKSFNGKTYRYHCETCASNYQTPLGESEPLNDGTTRPECHWCH